MVLSREFSQPLGQVAQCLCYTVGSETKDLRPGECMVTPCGAAHGFSNPHSLVARAPVILTPDTIAPQYFRVVGAIVNAGGPTDRQRLVGVMQKYGLAPVASPVAG